MWDWRSIRRPAPTRDRYPEARPTMRREPHLAILPSVLILALVAAAILPAPSARAAEGAPKAVVAEPVVDAGEVPVGERVEAEFTLENRGTAPLEIVRVRPACGCTVAEYDETIAPGATGSVRAVVDTTNLVGPNAKAVTVYTNDPDNPRIQLTVKSNPRPFLVVEPGYARFTSFVHGEEAESQPQLLWADDFEGLEVTGVETPEPWIGASFRRAAEAERSEDGAGPQWRIDVTLAPEAPVGPMADRVVVRTNHPRQTTIEIPVSGFVRPMVAVTPPRVDFGRVDPSEEQQWGILVRNFGAEPLEIREVRSTVPGIDVDVEPLEEGQRYKLVFTPTPALEPGPFDGRVELRTNLEKQPTVTVSLKGERM